MPSSVSRKAAPLLKSSRKQIPVQTVVWNDRWRTHTQLHRPLVKIEEGRLLCESLRHENGPSWRLGNWGRHRGGPRRGTAPYLS
jgi:hypothetical protein